MADGDTLPATRTISLTKGRHRFRITYEVGQEPAVLDAIADMVLNCELPIGPMDGARLLRQIDYPLVKLIERVHALRNGGAR